ncbi:hypothetical protein [Brunnivagina elsteri]|uniref:Uncharacterized protein n=1 Tax=Brunnivagina elsteri CCALA 953 TaxID=987040 RepID=A0A2A2TD96_9CYAN|nr:hypothetical protein [Calothrix elsteri]PAX51720.1 hypothetical protein CK510_23280 [Calothrix elsteri CCALA 953]
MATRRVAISRSLWKTTVLKVDEVYQLKNSSSIVWGEGEKSICDDFYKQHQLNRSASKGSLLFLVVACEKLKEKLNKDIPILIQNYSQVIYFCYENSLSKIIEKEVDFKKSIEYLCAFDNPEPDKIECVASVLLGAWLAIDKTKASVMDAISKAQEYIPSYIRSFQAELPLDPEVQVILDGIDNFTYNLTRGFLHWEFQGRGIYKTSSKLLD